MREKGSQKCCDGVVFRRAGVKRKGAWNRYARALKLFLFFFLQSACHV
jgi:hypothetical protein